MVSATLPAVHRDRRVDHPIDGELIADARERGLAHRSTGFGVLQQVRGNSRTRFVPVVVLTSSSQESDVNRSYALGANSYVSTPIDYAEHETSMSLIAAYWLHLNRMPVTTKASP